MAKNKASFSGLFVGNTAKAGRSVTEAHIARIALSDNCTLCVGFGYISYYVIGPSGI